MYVCSRVTTQKYKCAQYCTVDYHQVREHTRAANRGPPEYKYLNCYNIYRVGPSYKMIMGFTISS